MDAMLPDISVISLGGTIAATAAPNAAARDDGDGGGVAPTLHASDLVRAVPLLHDIARIESTTFRQVPSGDLTFDDIVELGREIDHRIDSGAAGVVVTQGTDTIEETAFALDLLLARSQPVVVTGAMRNPTLAGSDGPANLVAAVRVAASSSATGLGCVVVMNDEIHAARFVHKVQTSNPAAFNSAPLGPIGWVVEGRPWIGVRPARIDAALGAAAPVPAVALVTVVLGDDGALIDRISSLGYAGLVVEGFGGGHVPSALAPILGRLAERIPVVLASRTGGGAVLRETYASAGSERDLLARGLIPAGYLDGLKARVLLTLLLASGADADGVRAGFSRCDN